MLKVREWPVELGLGAYAEAFANYDIDEHVLSDLMEDDLKETRAWSRPERRRHNVDPSSLCGDGEDAAAIRTTEADRGS